jgi:hypothetical protein
LSGSVSAATESAGSSNIAASSAKRREFLSLVGQEPPVEVFVQFERLRSRPASLNGRFPASELLAALPQRGQFQSFA